jgi:hypothetical protein
VPKLRYRHHAFALLGYLAMALVMTYPLAREFTRAIPGDGFDGWQNVWNLWWVKRALLVEGSSPYFTRMVDYPVGAFLYFHTLNIFNGLTFLPITLGGGPMLAYNVAALFSFVAGGYGAYLLGLQVISRAPAAGHLARHQAQVAAFLGGLVFVFSPYHMAHLLGHMQLISLEWLPFYALFTIRQLDNSVGWQTGGLGKQAARKSSASSRLRYALISTLFLVLVAACDWYYAFYMVLFTGLYWLWVVWHRRTWLAPTLGVAAVGLFFVLATSPVLVPLVRESTRADYMVPPAGSTERLSADLTAFLTPSELHPLWGGWAVRWADRFTASTSERTVFAGYSVLVLGLVALVTRWRLARFWGVSALVFAALALGPVLHIAGNTQWGGIGPIPLPYALLQKVMPLLRISRSVSRFDVVVMLSLGILAAIGLNWLLSRAREKYYNKVGSWLMAAGALGVVAVEFWVAPYPISVPETQPFHYRLAQETEPFAVMDIPMDWDRPANLLYQTVHQKPTVSGYTSRTNPMSPAWRTPVLQEFRYLGPDINLGDPQNLAFSVLTDLNVDYVIVHKTDLPPGDYRERTLALADEIFSGWPVVVDDDWLKVLKVPPTGTRRAYLVLGEGWAPREWSQGGPARSLARPLASLVVHLPKPQTVHLEVEVRNTQGATSLEVLFGQQVLSTQVVSQQEVTLVTPNLALPGGESVIQIHVDSAPEKVIVTAIRLVSDP